MWYIVETLDIYIIIAYLISTCNSNSHVKIDTDQVRTKPPRVWVGIATGLGGLVTVIDLSQDKSAQA